MDKRLENIPKNFLDYLRTIVFKNIDFYEISIKDIVQMWSDTKNKEAFKKIEEQRKQMEVKS
jgi:hypothetical protein